MRQDGEIQVKTAGVLLLGLLGFGGLIVLSVAGVKAAIAILVTSGTIVGMIALGNLLGGRTTPDRAPYHGDDDGQSQSNEAQADSRSIGVPTDSLNTGAATDSQSTEAQADTRSTEAGAMGDLSRS